MPADPPSDLPENLDELLEKVRPELEALTKAEFIKRTITRPRVLDLTGIVRASWAEIEGRIESTLREDVAKQRKAELAGIGERAWAFYAADLAAEEPGSDRAKAELARLGARVAEHDRVLFKWAQPLFGDDPDAAAQLADIARGRGRHDDGEDVLRLVAMYRSRWKQVPPGIISEDELKQAEQEARQLLERLEADADNAARDLAVRAYSLWARDYNELIALGRYLVRHEEDGLERFPGIRSFRASARASSAGSDSPDGSGGASSGGSGESTSNADEPQTEG